MYQSKKYIYIYSYVNVLQSSLDVPFYQLTKHITTQIIFFEKNFTIVNGIILISNYINIGPATKPNNMGKKRKKKRNTFAQRFSLFP